MTEVLYREFLHQVGACIDDLKSLSSYESLVSSATRREGSRPSGLPFCPLYLYGFSCPQLRSSREKGIRGRSASEIFPWSLRYLGPPPLIMLWEGAVRSASHTCSVYRLPSESIPSTFSSIVRKHTGPVKVEVRKSSRGSNSNIRAATKSAGQRQINTAMSGAASKGPSGRGASMIMAETPTCPQWVLKWLWPELHACPCRVLPDVMGRYA